MFKLLVVSLLAFFSVPAAATVVVAAEKIGPHSYYVRGLPGAALRLRVMVPGHGAASRTPQDDLTLTRDYLVDLRDKMGRAVVDFVPFDEAFAAADWSRWASLPAYAEAHRRNAYNTYLLMEQEALAK